jgi:hypothetical protein
VLVVCETTSGLGMHDVDHPIICWSRKHRQLVRPVGGFALCFHLDILMVHSSMLIVSTIRERLMYGDFSLGEIVCFGSLEFIADFFGCLSLSPGGGDSDAIFIGMTCSGSPSLQTIMEDSPNEFYMASSREGSSDLPVSRRLHMGASSAHRHASNHHGPTIRAATTHAHA